MKIKCITLMLLSILLIFFSGCSSQQKPGGENLKFRVSPDPVTFVLTTNTSVDMGWMQWNTINITNEGNAVAEVFVYLPTETDEKHYPNYSSTANPQFSAGLFGFYGANGMYNLSSSPESATLQKGESKNFSFAGRVFDATNYSVGFQALPNEIFISKGIICVISTPTRKIPDNESCLYEQEFSIKTRVFS